MALGIGANVALFTAGAECCLLPAAAVCERDQLVEVYERNAHGAFQDNVVAGGRYSSWRDSPGAFRNWPSSSGEDYDLSGSGQPAS